MRKTVAMAWPALIHRAGALVLLTLAVVSCDRANPVAPPDPSAAVRFSRLEVAPDTLELSEVGPSNSAALTTSAWDDAGRRMSLANALVTYSSSAPSIASVNDGGVVTARAPGTAEIHVTMTIDDVVRTSISRVFVADAGPAPAFGGAYDLTAPITDSDPAWGIEPGTRLVAEISIEHSVDGSHFTGRFSDYRAISPGGEATDGQVGWVSGVVHADGRAVLELTIEGSHSVHWRGEGRLEASEMAGTFGSNGHITGTFSAIRR